MPEELSDLIKDNLKTLTSAKRFEIWRKARENYNEIRRHGKESQWALQLMSAAYDAYMGR